MKMFVNPELCIRKIDGEIFIYDRNKALVHAFNETGAFIWEAIEHGSEKIAILQKLMVEYETSEQEVSIDFDVFCTTLETLGLVEQTI